MKKLLFLSALLPTIALGEGTLSVTPGHDFKQGQEAIFGFDSDFQLHDKFYLLPKAQLSTVTNYRDATGTLDFEYRWTEKFSTALGGTYDSYHHFGDDRVESEDIHATVKYKLWK